VNNPTDKALCQVCAFCQLPSLYRTITIHPAYARIAMGRHVTAVRASIPHLASGNWALSGMQEWAIQKAISWTPDGGLISRD
jgi:hypothetical protein